MTFNIPIDNDYWENEGASAAPATTSNSDGFPFMLEGDIINQPEPEYLIDEWFPENTLVMIWGQPKGAKSFLGLHTSMCLTHGLSWFGHEVRQGAVLYIAAEGSGGLGKRVRAWRQHHNATHRSSPLVIITVPVNMFDDSDTDKLIRQALQLEREYGFKFVAIVIDTLARCSGGADENSNQAMGLVVQNLDRMKREIMAMIMVIHHCGKNETNGPRGASCLTGAIDTRIHVERESPNSMTVFVTLEMQKDDDSGMSKIMSLVKVPLGLKKNGKALDSLVMTEKSRDVPIATPDLVPGAKGDPVYTDLVSIANQMAPNTEATVSDIALLVFRDKIHTKRVNEALPENIFRKVNTSDGVKLLRRLKAHKKGFVVQCQNTN